MILIQVWQPNDLTLKLEVLLTKPEDIKPSSLWSCFMQSAVKLWNQIARNFWQLVYFWKLCIHHRRNKSKLGSCLQKQKQPDWLYLCRVICKWMIEMPADVCFINQRWHHVRSGQSICHYWQPQFNSAQSYTPLTVQFKKVHVNVIPNKD